METFVEMNVSIQEVQTSDVARRSAKFHPTVWGEYFLKYALSTESDVVKMEQRVHHELRQGVREMLITSPLVMSLLEKLEMIDSIQRLGIAYHFETEIETTLQHIYENPDHHHDDKHDDGDDDLHTCALWFRLLRQYGYRVSCGIFKKFKDNKGKFKATLCSDMKGMLSLYEATHLRIRGEDILEEALSFTITHLKVMIHDNFIRCPHLAPQVNHALDQPIHTGLARIEARRYISFYEEDDSHNKNLLNFAKLDFNMLQKAHQRELSEITRWWKDLNFANKLPFIRDRVVEGYFWILGVYFEPHYALARSILTKVFALASIIDDIYDIYGTLEELALFTKAIERWDRSANDQLPEYMKCCYQALLDVYEMIEKEVILQERLYSVEYAKESMKDLVRAYFEEAKLFHQGYIPTMEEYMSIALETGGYVMLATTSFVGMEPNLTTKETFQWVSSYPLIVKASSMIARLTNDIIGHKFEQERGHVASAVECYMKQHDVSEAIAVAELNKQVRDAWKDMNSECLQPTAVPIKLLTQMLNLTRVINVIYKDKGNYTDSRTMVKAFITSILVDPVPLPIFHESLFTK